MPNQEINRVVFLAPALLGALVLASAPVIIHLLNRRRFTRVEWGPMHYLKLTMRANRRRVRLEQWLLLALRTLAVAALIFAVARPVSEGAHLGSMLALPGRASRVIVVDDSLSMSADNAGTAWSRAIAATTAALEQVGDGDEVSVLLTSRPDDPLLKYASVGTPDAVVARLREEDVSDTASDWPATLSSVARLLDSATYPVKEVVLVTDLGRAGWGNGVAATASMWAAGEVAFRVIDVGRDAPANLSAGRIELADPLVLAGTEARLSVPITNRGEDAENVQATLRVSSQGGVGAETAIPLPPLPAGETVRVPLPWTFEEPGRAAVEFTLPPDGLPGDDRSLAAVDVRPELDVVLIDGDPGPRPFTSETDFVALALSAGYGRVKVRQIVAADWAAQPLSSADVIVLANLDELPADRIEELDRLVRGGTGLMVFPGAGVDPEATNAALYRGGGGPLPAALGELFEPDADSASGVVLEGGGDSPLEALAALKPALLAEVRPASIATVEMEPDGPSRVLARWNDAAGSPAAISRSYGNGTVLLWTVAADREGSNWPTKPSFVLAMRSAVFAIAAGGTGELAVAAGDPIVETLDPDRRPERVSVSVPGEAEPSAAAIAEDGASARFGETRRAGLYGMAWEEPGGGEITRPVAVRPAAEDGDAGRLPQEELARLVAPLSVDVIPWSGGDLSRGPEATELWRWFVIAMLALLLAESCLGAWIDRGRASARGGESFQRGKESEASTSVERRDSHARRGMSNDPSFGPASVPRERDRTTEADASGSLSGRSTRDGGLA